MVELYDIKALSEKVTRGELTAHGAAAQIETTMQILKQLCEEEKPLGPNQRRTESGQVYTVVNKSRRIPTS